MAVLTATTRTPSSAGNSLVIDSLLPAISDGDTYDTGLTYIIPGSVQITAVSTSTVAADSCAVGSISGGVITFEVAGTARAANVTARGY